MKTIDLDRLRKLNISIALCDVEYHDGLDRALDVPQEIKDAWKEYSESKKKFADALSKYDIELSM